MGEQASHVKRITKILAWTCLLVGWLILLAPFASAQSITQAKETLEKETASIHATRDLKMKELKVKVLTAMQSQMATYRSAGKLEEVLAYRAEIDAIGESDGIPSNPPSTIPSTIPGLAKLQKAAQAQAETIEQNAAQAESKLLNSYHKGMDGLMKSLTQQGLVAEALTARNERDAAAMRMKELGLALPATPGGSGSISPARLLREASVYLNFETASGGRSKDVSGNGKHGVLKKVAPLRQGARGKAIAVDGTTGGVQIPHDSIEPGKPFTVSLWAKGISGKFGRILQLSGQDNKGFDCGICANEDKKSLLGFIRLDKEKHLIWNTDGEVSDEKWTHVAMVYDGESPKLYLNGKEDGAMSRVYYSMSASGDAACWIGRRQTTLKLNTPDQARAMKGQLDEFMIFPRALSPKEINLLSRLGTP